MAKKTNEIRYYERITINPFTNSFEFESESLYLQKKMKQMNKPLSFSVKLQKSLDDINEKMDKLNSNSKFLVQLSKNKGGVK